VQLEIGIELPRHRAEDDERDPEKEKPERGVAVLDFYI
jgi:hypothetical protein